MTDTVDTIPKPEGKPKSRMLAYKTLDKQQGIQKMIRIIKQLQKRKGLPFKLEFIDLDNQSDKIIPNKLLQITEDDYAELPMSLIPGNSYLVCMIFNKGIVYDLDSAKMGLIAEVTDVVEEPLPDFDYIPPNTDVPSVSDDKPVEVGDSPNKTVTETGSQSLTETINPLPLLSYESDSIIELNVENVKKYFKLDKFSDEDIKMSLQLCILQNLNPFINDVYLIPYYENDAKKRKIQIVVSKDVFLKKAEQHDDYEGF